MAKSNSKPPMSQNLCVGTSHVRSLSQPTIFSNNCLPPLSPFVPSESSIASANSSLKDTSMEEVDTNFQGPTLVSSFNRDGLPPRKGHRRSNSDVPLGFSAMIQSSPQLMPISGPGISGKAANLGDKANDHLLFSCMNLEDMEVLKSCGTGDRDNSVMINCTKISGCDSSNNEAESVLKGSSLKEGVKRSADAADISPTVTRHFRSLSMDSAIGNFHYAGDESPKLPASLINGSCQQLSPSNSGNESSSKHSFDFGNAEFSEAEVKKIMADERLAEIAVLDPKRAKRILANRQSAARSKERKLRYISELEHKVQKLQTEATNLSTQVTILQKDLTEFSSLNNELKFRLQAMEQQAQLRDALHEALTAEVQRLKVAAGELTVTDEGRFRNIGAQQMPMKHNMFQQLSAGKPTNTSSASPTSASA